MIYNWPTDHFSNWYLPILLKTGGQMSDQIIRKVKWATERYYSVGYLLMEVREIRGEINQHVSITKDKFGEISLNCLMLRQLLELNNQRIASER